MKMILVRVCLSLLCFLSFTTLVYSQTVYDFASIKKILQVVIVRTFFRSLNVQTHLMSIYTLEEQREITTVIHGDIIELD